MANVREQKRILANLSEFSPQRKKEKMKIDGEVLQSVIDESLKLSERDRMMSGSDIHRPIAGALIVSHKELGLEKNSFTVGVVAGILYSQKKTKKNPHKYRPVKNR